MSYVLEASYKHGAGVTLLRTDDDVDGFLTELLDAGQDYRSATVYAVDECADEDPTHELVVGVDQASALGAVRYADDDGEWFSRGEQVKPDGVRYLYYGTAHEFPADSEVPLDVVRQALQELLANQGMRPEGLSWQAATELR
ncbi:Imm1 family immunity protein [Lentzea californiensis]|uniref:Imm1 family immunity protein n=1 Tax=Lentzea californiensis TaxID=438851 RepID=UPI0021643D83|nr:Imm1 family immunity protein [Lentzea californiensis]MCR3746115.1 Immunity protein Imm1 [Lentzea californiensis]